MNTFGVDKIQAYFKIYLKIAVAFTITIVMVRVFEYFQVGDKSLIEKPILFESFGIVYDCWTVAIYSSLVLLITIPIALFSNKIAFYSTHVLHVFFIIIYIGLIIVFKERNTPFDHEFFTRNFADSWLTSKQMLAGDIFVLLPFAFYIGIYLLLENIFRKRFVISKKQAILYFAILIISTSFMSFSAPNKNNFLNRNAYYLTINKLNYWVRDSYHYFQGINEFEPNNLSTNELGEQIKFYQKNQPFNFTSEHYPLLHIDSNKDVLGPFFNLDKDDPPNIVILVIEGLSRDFSGDNAYATSFTPFLDALSSKSLTWNNFLSTAPGTFAAQPAITGSLPYGKKGFSLINVMPDHLSLIKILKNNGYHTKFLIGFNPDFDNMGGYIRLQGTDMILTKYGAKYKQMGVGEEGWTMGYPDDALYNRSFEVLDSINNAPYLSIYHTGTTHMPYLFEQKKKYEHLFDQKMSKINVTPAIKQTLIESKSVLTTFMFSDDCLKDFFNKYSKRPDYKNTIFFIMGDHHIGSFPSTSGIDDYHVPLIVYSPLLKYPKKFFSINTHNNLTPTITALLFKNYPTLRYQPKEVHWLTGPLDTTVKFSNSNAMPFMEWSREITDYIYKEYYLTGDQLYKLNERLTPTIVDNDSLKTYITKLRDNFKLINNYVCDKNLIYPKTRIALDDNKELLFEYDNKEIHNYNLIKSDTSLLPDVAITKNYKNIYVELNAEINSISKGLSELPAFRLSIVDNSNRNRNFLYWTNHDINQLTKSDFKENQWNMVSTKDMLPFQEFNKYHHLAFNLSFFTSVLPVQLQARNIKIKVYGVLY